MISKPIFKDNTMLKMFVSFSEPLLKCVFNALIYEDPIFPAEAIVVLVGPSNGCRINAAAKLFHAGYAEKLVFSGFAVGSGMNIITSIMKEQALISGVPERNIIIEDTDEEASTRGEGIANLKLLKKYNIKKFILLTSDFHTRRSRLIYKRLISLDGYDVDFSVYPAIDPDFPIHDWWNRWRARRWVFLEYIKLIRVYLNL